MTVALAPDALAHAPARPQEGPLSLNSRQEDTHQNSPSSCTVTPIFSLSLLLTFCHSSDLGCEYQRGNCIRGVACQDRFPKGELWAKPPQSSVGREIGGHAQPSSKKPLFSPTRNCDLSLCQGYEVRE